MGRKLRGAALRAHKRGNVHAEEIVDQKATEVERSSVTTKPNEDLFVIDTVGDKNARQAPKSLQEPKQVKKHVVPKLDQARVEKLVEKHTPQELEAMVKQGAAELKGRRRRKQHVFDLWGDDTATTKKTKREIIGGIKVEHNYLAGSKRAKPPPAKDAVAVDLPQAGQSYRPDPDQYNATVQAAVEVELKRQKAEQYNKEPLANGMSAETRALLVNSSDEEESDSDNEEEPTTTVLHKHHDKMTRAQRNKQKRLRQERAAQDEQRKNKKFLNSVAEIPRYKKELKKAEKDQKEKKETLQQQKIAQHVAPGKNLFAKMAAHDPIKAPSFPVALGEDLNAASASALRQIKPKGNLITDRMASFVDRNMIVGKRKWSDKKRANKQGKRRKLKYHGSGVDIAKMMRMDHAKMG